MKSGGGPYLEAEVHSPDIRSPLARSLPRPSLSAGGQRRLVPPCVAARRRCIPDPNSHDDPNGRPDDANGLGCARIGLRHPVETVTSKNLAGCRFHASPFRRGGYDECRWTEEQDEPIEPRPFGHRKGDLQMAVGALHH